MQPSSQQQVPTLEESNPEQFNLRLPTTGSVLRVQLKDAPTQDQKNVRIGNVGALDWLFGKRG